MRKATISISERNLMYVIGGQLFEQTPNGEPRNVSSIMKQVRDKFRNSAVNFNEWYSINIEEAKLENFIRELLITIPEFVNLNLSHNEVVKGIDVNDESRGKFKFTSLYDKHTTESWKSDFIDLDAFIRNVYGKLLTLIISDIDCVLCKHIDSDKFCTKCIHNNDYSSNYTGNRELRNGYAFNCKYDCKFSYMICCEDCAKNKDCTDRCISTSDTCGLKVLE